MGPARHRWLAGGRGALSERGGGPREGPSGRSNVSSPPLFERPTKPPPLRPPTATARGATDAAAVAAALTAPTVDSAPAGVVGAAGFGAMPSIGRVRSSAIPPGHSPHGVRHGLGSGGGRGRRRKARGGGGPPGMGGAPPAPSLAPAATLKKRECVLFIVQPNRPVGRSVRRLEEDGQRRSKSSSPGPSTASRARCARSISSSGTPPRGRRIIAARRSTTRTSRP